MRKMFYCIVSIFFLVLFSMYSWWNSLPAKEVDKGKSENYFFNHSAKKIIYSPMGVWFKLEKYEILGADVSSFKVIADDYALDKNFVYYKGNKLLGADLSTFKEVDSTKHNTRFEYMKDKQAVYFQGEKIQADTNKFKLICMSFEEGYCFGSDENFVYYGKDLVSKSSASFKFVNSYYAKDLHGVYFAPNFDSINVDVASFVRLNDYLARDKFAIYGQWGYKFSKFDLDSFRVFDNYYVKDKNNIYYVGELSDRALAILDVDRDSFSVLEKGYAKDKNNIYYIGQAIIGADVKTFNIDKNGTVSDAYHKYLGSHAI